MDARKRGKGRGRGGCRIRANVQIGAMHPSKCAKVLMRSNRFRRSATNGHRETSQRPQKRDQRRVLVRRQIQTKLKPLHGVR